MGGARKIYFERTGLVQDLGKGGRTANEMDCILMARMRVRIGGAAWLTGQWGYALKRCASDSSPAGRDIVRFSR